MGRRGREGRGGRERGGGIISLLNVGVGHCVPHAIRGLHHHGVDTNHQKKGGREERGRREEGGGRREEGGGRREEGGGRKE